LNRMAPKVHLVSLGCPKNSIDSEILLCTLLREGYEPTPDPQEADLIFVNTCAFIEKAREEAVETILEMASWKELGRCKGLIVVGCLAQRYGEELLDLMPEVDLFLGTGEIPKVRHHLENLQKTRRYCQLSSLRYILEEEPGSRRLVSGPTAYVRIAEGCSNRCSYCALPAIRGPLRSRPLNSIVREVRDLVERGVREVILVAQDTTSYGKDRSGTSELPQLLSELDRIEGLHWLRVMYAHPRGLDERVLEALARTQKLCPYLDVPIQHASRKILQRMNRGIGPDDIRLRISMLREAIPGIHLRSTVIVGFPGETEEDFEELLNFLDEVRFEWLGGFVYSMEEGTEAALMPHKVPKRLAQKRLSTVMARQKAITQRALKRWVGKELEVLVEGVKRTSFSGRTSFQAPGIDGVVRVKGTITSEHTFARVLITGVRGYDLEGSLMPLSSFSSSGL
jgi:ribosomal protein S12 methylthiotransferase